MIYIALGRRRLGKTTLCLYMARRIEQRVIFDPRGLVESPLRVRTSEAVRTVLAFGDEAPDARYPTEVIVTPDHDLQGNFDALARFVKRWSQERDESLFFLIDEARFVRLLDSSAFEYIVRAAPPDKVHIAITAHRPADVPTDIRAISDHWLLFRSTQEHDLKVIEERCGIAVRRRVSQLKPHEFVHWNDAEGTYSVNTNPASWYVPLGVPVREAATVLPDTEPDTTRLL